MHAKGSSSEKLSIRMRNPCNRQLISIHVRLQFFDSLLRGFFAKSWTPLFEQPLRQLRGVFWVLNQVANLNSAHTNSVFGPMIQAQSISAYIESVCRKTLQDGKPIFRAESPGRITTGASF